MFFIACRPPSEACVSFIARVTRDASGDGQRPPAVEACSEAELGLPLHYVLLARLPLTSRAYPPILPCEAFQLDVKGTMHGK